MNIIKYACVLLRALFPSIWINFKCLPLNQALKLPIIVYKPKFLSLKGHVVIESNTIHFGMIKMGFYTSVLYPNSGITIKNDGKLVFKGDCHIGNDCYVVCEKPGMIEFGEGFKVTAGLRMVSVRNITFDKNVLVGWDNTIIDTNFHPLYDIVKNKIKEKEGEIHIGSNNWFAAHCIIMPNVITPPNCTFGISSVITKNNNYESNCVYGGNPIRILSKNVIRIN